MNTLNSEALELLKQLIAVASFSKTENKTATLIETFFAEKNIPTQRLLHNVWAKNKCFDASKPTILLNSHHDTVQPNSQYTKNPFEAIIENGKLYGLGSNDSGGPLVSLISCFLYFYDEEDLKFNLILAATAEEEISGKNGVELLLPHLGKISFAIVGEPTKMDIAIAEKGLLVIDCTAHGKTGHAAREEGENAIYKAVQDIQWFQNYKFPKISAALGPVKMSVTMIQAGLQHNIVPEKCVFTVDIRTTDSYNNEEILEVIRQNVSVEIQPRSVRLNPSSVPEDHPLVKIGKELNCRLYGSPTTSDQALMSFSTFKMGPGDSARSHSADEFIYVNEIHDGIALYIKLLNTFNQS